MTPRATYRLQFHQHFTFADAEALVPYLAALGISHLYASPITTARAGSTHGYDVVDPTRINPELDGEAAFRQLVAALRAHEMGIIIDIVPNHIGVAGGGNGWWNDVLARGQASDHARTFDIDWRRKLVLPILGDPLATALAQGDIAIAHDGDGWHVLAYGEHRLPIRPEDQDGLDASADVGALLGRQHYRLASWRTANDDLNWRRFFTINDLAGVRIEDADVFEAVHALYFRLYREGLIDGVRVDHVDGLTDPAGYCRKLRARLDAIERPADAPAGPAYIVVEKILGPGEPLATNWGVDGTSGYDFMAEVAALLHAPDGEVPLGALWAAVSGRSAAFAPEELRARQDMLSWQFEGQLTACVAAFVSIAAPLGFTAAMLRRAVERLLWVFPVYRTYGTGKDAPAIDAPIRAEARRRVSPFVPPGEAPVVDAVLGWLAGTGPGDATAVADAVRRFQQLSAPIAAKAVEDTAFYRHGRLLSNNDVGFDAACFSLPIERFHAVAAARGRDFPGAMLATATHDHKRGEDVRARLAVLSEIPDIWRDHVAGWERNMSEDGIDPADRYMLYQTLFGAWPEALQTNDRAGLAAFAARVNGWQQKALREAKLRSSWEAPDADYESRAHRLVEQMLDPGAGLPFLAEMAELVAFAMPAAQANTLAQTTLHFTLPGVPDLYQGAELLDLSLVDPDNRRAVDHDRRRAMLDGGATRKFALIRALLAMRRSDPMLFAKGSYTPVQAMGPRANNVFAFERHHGPSRVVCAVALRCAAPLVGTTALVPPESWWGDTVLPIDGKMVAVAAIFTSMSVHVQMIDAR
ncbi:malto-oligosyltrehalose synthase [Polymorphobacter multimanifer]|uniref:(1->4)-alpha-D-glucan 1-alpha-D-glucosylmutase n=1 Tax=Polymorphobacter multimanifer TaxID=1070431 RepID=A0A841LAF2_9SPHN|nr:malto-oligosyltrehalose synthase [Polymorphobacter multimanifer]MBB6226132.1 (1->4)-alpha-D-glucan 1-alpha-D-glucosylmutase [Polymorphobacter multimanifer]GGI71961.1 malto-oligosyltrehalose synthase [Polymorphobacter multimanifer]